MHGSHARPPAPDPKISFFVSIAQICRAILLAKRLPPASGVSQHQAGSHEPWGSSGASTPTATFTDDQEAANVGLAAFDTRPSRSLRRWRADVGRARRRSLGRSEGGHIRRESLDRQRGQRPTPHRLQPPRLSVCAAMAWRSRLASMAVCSAICAIDPGILADERRQIAVLDVEDRRDASSWPSCGTTWRIRRARAKRVHELGALVTGARGPKQHGAGLWSPLRGDERIRGAVRR